MPLPFILQPPPGKDGFREWMFAHSQDHEEIREGIQTLKGVNLPIYVLDPVSQDDFQGWLERHQQAHNDMNGILNLSGEDLTGLDPSRPEQLQAWMFLNFHEHQSARQVLAI
jgi:hypothetical protein